MGIILYYKARMSVEQVKVFHEALKGACTDKGARDAMWTTWDPNGNGFLSLAECDGALQKVFLGKNREDVWKAFRPSYIRAFNDAKDAAKSIGEHGDDYVSKREFRLLLVYLNYYADWYSLFAELDGGGAGVDAGDDRKISKDEWTNGVGKLKENGSHWS